MTKVWFEEYLSKVSRLSPPSIKWKNTDVLLTFMRPKLASSTFSSFWRPFWLANVVMLPSVMEWAANVRTTRPMQTICSHLHLLTVSFRYRFATARRSFAQSRWLPAAQPPSAWPPLPLPAHEPCLQLHPSLPVVSCHGDDEVQNFVRSYPSNNIMQWFPTCGAWHDYNATTGVILYQEINKSCIFSWGFHGIL